LDVDTFDSKCRDALDTLAEIGVAVGVDPLNASPFEIARLVSEKADREFEVEFRTEQVVALQGSVEKDLADMVLLKECLEEIQRNQDEQRDVFDEKVSEYTRGIKLLEAKTKEYNSRMAHVTVCPKFWFIN
jgi:hypothetical protein